MKITKKNPLRPRGRSDEKRQSTKDAIREAYANGPPKEVQIIPAKKDMVTAGEHKKLRVCAYCRVSTEEDNQASSYELQVQNYTKMIQENPEWEFAGIFADEGTSGTSVLHREHFLEMIEKCKAGDIDLIITKQVSRFARNVLDSLNYIFMLRKLDPPVGVYFETEKLNTLDRSSDMVITVLSLVAQSESEQKSNSLKWSFKRRRAQGLGIYPNWSLLGYKGHEWEIDEDEADVVRTMLHSLSAQVSYYSELIQNHDEWLYVGVYIDEAKTGTKDSREGFQRLIEDCRVGKINMVITKSISRFARNTVTLLQTVRDFKAMGVDVFFEEQNIHTLSGDGELMMTILASYAQEESRSVSENQKWRIKRNFEEGKPWDGTLLGYRLRNGRYEILTEEAEIVCRIFSEYLSGSGYGAIAKGLNEEGVPSRFGGRWMPSVISKVLSNYTYTGNLVLQKTYRENHLTKKSLINKGQLPQYHVEDSHPAIVDMDTFNAVQEEKARRATRFNKHPQSPKSYPFSSLLVCANCGKYYRRKITKTGPVWVCGTFNTLGKAHCASKQIPEEALISVTTEVIGKSPNDESVLKNCLSQITIHNGNRLLFTFADGTTIERIWQDRSRSQSWTPEMKEAARQRALERRKSNA